MKDKQLPAPLLVVTDRGLARAPLERQIAAILAGGARWVWFREKDLPRDERRALAARVMAVTREAGGVFSVGGDIELAAELGADAAHLSSAAKASLARETLGEAALIGVSAHTLAEVAAARAAGADYVTLSPIYLTASKPGYGPALGPAVIAAAAALGIPTLALGGLHAGNLTCVKAAGAAGAAIMGELMRAERPAELAAALLARWRDPAVSPPQRSPVKFP